VTNAQTNGPTHADNQHTAAHDTNCVARETAKQQPVIEVADNEDDSEYGAHCFANLDDLRDCIKANMRGDGGGTWEEALMAVKSAYELLGRHSYSLNSVVFRFPNR